MLWTILTPTILLHLKFGQNTMADLWSTLKSFDGLHLITFIQSMIFINEQRILGYCFQYHSRTTGEMILLKGLTFFLRLSGGFPYEIFGKHRTSHFWKAWNIMILFFLSMLGIQYAVSATQHTRKNENLALKILELISILTFAFCIFGVLYINFLNHRNIRKIVETLEQLPSLKSTDKRDYILLVLLLFFSGFKIIVSSMNTDRGIHWEVTVNLLLQGAFINHCIFMTIISTKLDYIRSMNVEKYCKEQLWMILNLKKIVRRINSIYPLPHLLMVTSHFVYIIVMITYQRIDPVDAISIISNMFIQVFIPDIYYHKVKKRT